ncbi:hypothetical protein AB0C34_17305 [Nocardia sp. NPDC049220]|uniref:hypothetical protein n=1 Tax=Nocardia sp. NPDC049220 TaxID=3155273 RepID=UPI003408EBBC
MTLTTPIADAASFSRARADAADLAEQTATEIGNLTYAVLDCLAHISAGALNAAVDSASVGRDCFDELLAKLQLLSVAARRDPEAIPRLQRGAAPHINDAIARIILAHPDTTNEA